MSAHLPLWHPVEGTEGTGRLDPDQGGGSRLTAAASQAARDLTRLQASRDAVASEVVAFQVERQRARLAATDDPDIARIIVPLSARESEILALVAAGRSDGEIADALFISKKTASVHVANIKGKLGAASRVEIAVVARRLGLVDDSAPAAAATPVEPVPSPAAGRVTVICPFKGLAAYESSDAPYFFGREQAVAEVVARLAASTFVAVTGSSGSGKSSLLRAGLAAALRAGVLPGSESWPIAILRPGAAPRRELARALRDELGTSASTPDAPADWTALLEGVPAGARITVIVDQFEEAFTVCPDAAERQAFIDALVALAGDPARRALVVVAIRGDFYGRCAEHPALASLIGASTVLIGPMTADELTRAIELPTRAAGLRMDADLAPLLVSDVLAQPGALPLLSATLLDLWQRREGRLLRTDAYRRVGGVRGAVARLADGAIERLSPGERDIARGILLRLSSLADSGVAVRRRASLAELGAARPEVARVLEVLADQRLVSVDEGEVDLAHEALLRDWPRMRRWIEEDAEGRRVRERLGRAAEEWTASAHDPGELYRGQRLAAAVEWAAAHEADLNDRERSFLTASRRASEAVLQHERHQNTRLRRLLAAVAALLVVVIAAGSLALAQAGAARDQAAIAAQRAQEADAARGQAEQARGAAESARTTALEAERLAHGRALVAASTAALSRDTTLARLLAVAAADIIPDEVATEAALHAAYQSDPVLARLQIAPAQSQLHGVVDPAGERVASLLPEDVIQVNDIATGSVAWTFHPTLADVHVDRPWFSADGSQVMVPTYYAPAVDPKHPNATPPPPPSGLGILLLDASTGSKVGVLDDGPCGTWIAAASKRWLVTGRAVFGAVPWCYGDRGEPGYGFGLLNPSTGEWRWLTQDGFGDMAISADGRVAGWQAEDGPDHEMMTRFVDVASGRVLSKFPTASITQQDRMVRAISADGSLALVGDRPIAVVDTATGEVLATLGGGQGEHMGFAFGAGDIAYTSGREGTLRAWDARKGYELLAVPAVATGDVSVASDGRVLVTDFVRGLAALVDLRVRGEVETVPTCVGVLFPARQLQVRHGIVAVGGDCGAEQPTYTWALDRWRQLATMPNSTAQAIALSPDGARIVRQELENGKTQPLAVFDTATGRKVTTLQGMCAWGSVDPRADSPGCKNFPDGPFPFWAVSMGYSPDGRVIFATDSADASQLDPLVAAWDAASGKLLWAWRSPKGVGGWMFTPDAREVLISTGTGFETVSTSTWTVVGGSGPAVDTPQQRVALMAWLDGGKTLLMGTGIGNLDAPSLLWVDATTFTVKRQLRLLDAVKSFAVSPSGKLLALGASNGVVRVYRAEDGVQVHQMAVRSQAQGVAFLDEATLAITPHEGGVIVETLDRARLLAVVRSGLTRGFTADECDQYDLATCPTLEDLTASPPASAAPSAAP